MLVYAGMGSLVVRHAVGEAEELDVAPAQLPPLLGGAPEGADAPAGKIFPTPPSL